MDRGHSSPVLLQHPSLLHALIPQLPTLSPTSSPQPESLFIPTPPPQEQTASLESTMSGPAESPALPPESHPQPPQQAEQPSSTAESRDGLSNATLHAENSETAPSETVPSEARSAAQDVQNSPQAGSNAEERANAQASHRDTPVGEIAASNRLENPAGTSAPEVALPVPESAITLPPPPVEEPKPEIPEWVMHEEDTSEPDEVELKEIETGNEDFSALDFKHYEKYFFHQLDDPEQRPVKRFRLHWTIKGVRGTKEKPNYARVLNSPPAYIHGLYWHIKFFPRGNNSSALSAYIKCSRTPPDPDIEVPESTFAVFQGSVDTDLSEIKPEIELKLPATQPEPKEEAKSPSSSEKTEPEHKSTLPEPSEEVSPEEIVHSVETEEPEPLVREDDEDWRVSAQLGLIIYNPVEPRTCHWSTSEHQFNKHNDDWGWTNFSGPWKDIHRRKQGQRAPLLRNDTIAMDAYIQIFDDPTQALWWHAAPETENQWDSKSLTGYFPMGTPPLYHSPGVAGLTALLLLAPFRKLIQNIDTSLWRRDSHIKPQPLLCQLQHVLFLMRTMHKDETYVNVNHVLETLDTFGETYCDVKVFWEALRRSIELETESNGIVHRQLAEIFDGKGKNAVTLSPSGYVKIPVCGVKSVQEGLNATFDPNAAKHSFPDFLPVLLDRQKFDSSSREWKLLYDRVRLSEEIDLSACSSDVEPAKYTLYGFMAHVGERTSAKFYSVLRPNGPGTKWLAFEDGDGNKVFSYTKRRIEKFEGLEGEELENFKGTSQTAYMAMYVRTSRFKEYLPGALEPYEMADWLKPCLSTRWHGEDKTIAPADAETETEIEIYFGSSVKGRQGLLDMFNLKEVDKEDCCELTVPSETTFAEVRQQIAGKLKIEQVEKIRLWIMQYSPLGEYMTASMIQVPLADTVGLEAKEIRPLCLWLQIIEKEGDIKLYGYPDPTAEEIQARKEELDEDALMDDEHPRLRIATRSGGWARNADSSQMPILREVPAASADADLVAATDTTTSPETSTDQAPELYVVVATGESIDPHPVIADTPIHTDTFVIADTPVLADVPTLADTPVPAGTHSEAVEPGPEDSTSGPDALQVSVQEAVRHDVEAPNAAIQIVLDAAPAARTHSTQPEPPSAPSEDSYIPVVQGMQQNSDAPTEPHTESDAVPVEHGHLVDALDIPAFSEGAPNAAGTPREATRAESFDAINNVQAENEALIVSIIAADVAAAEEARPEGGSTAEVDASVEGSADTNLETEPANSNPALISQNDYTPHTANTPRSEPLPEERPLRPVRHVYGFLQMFDADKQNFYVRDAFFAEWNADVKTTVRQRLGFDADREFLVWQRIKAYNTSPISSSTTFSDINFRDGVDLIIGDVLSDDKKDELLAEGKFVTPSSLSRVLHMTSRKHPVQGFTGTTTLQEFGGGFYRGPMLNGRYHGENGTWIMANGHQYTGSFLSDEKSGAGTMIYQNGDVYEGTWLKDEKHGQGTMIEKRTGNKYIGGFENGKRWGEGVTYWKVADEQSDMCQICYCEDIDALFYDCGHVCACVECAKQCESCPICRKPVAKVVKMYKA